MPHSIEGELFHIFQEAVRREAQYQARFAFLSNTAGDEKLKALFNEFVAVSRRRLQHLKTEMKHFNIKYF